MKLTFTLFAISSLSFFSYAQTYFEKQYGTNGFDYSMNAFATPDSGMVSLGYTFNYGAGQMDGYVVKLDKNGNRQWSKSYGGSQMDEFYNGSTTNDGGYIFVGYTNSFGTGGDDFYIVKTDMNGNVVWSTTYGTTLNDRSKGVEQLSDNSFIIAGQCGNPVGIGLVHLDQNGNIIWQTVISDCGADEVHATSDGALLIGGCGVNGLTLCKTDLSGVIIWAKTYPQLVAGFTSYCETPDGGYAVLSSSYSYSSGANDIIVMKTNSSGIVQWANSYGTALLDETSGKINLSSNGNLMIGGVAEDLNSSWSAGIYLEIDNSGNMVTSKFVNGDLHSVFNSSCGTIFLAGYSDLYTVQADAVGYNSCAIIDTSFISLSHNFSDSLITPNDTATLSGVSITPSVTNGGTQMLICDATYVNEESLPVVLNFNPNPSCNFTIAEFDPNMLLMGSQLFLYNSIAQEVRRIEMTGSSIRIEKSELEAGIYYWKVVSENGTLSTGKIIFK